MFGTKIACPRKNRSTFREGVDIFTRSKAVGGWRYDFNSLFIYVIYVNNKVINSVWFQCHQQGCPSSQKPWRNLSPPFLRLRLPPSPLSFSSPSPSLPFPSPRSRTSLNPVREGLGERCELLQWDLGRSPQPKSNLVHFSLKIMTSGFNNVPQLPLFCAPRISLTHFASPRVPLDARGHHSSILSFYVNSNLVFIILVMVITCSILRA